MLGGHRQAVDPRPVFGIEHHPIDDQLVGIVVASLAVLTGERNDMAAIFRVIDDDREVNTTSVAMGVSDSAACELAP